MQTRIVPTPSKGCVSEFYDRMNSSLNYVSDSQEDECVRVTFAHGVYRKRGSNQGLASGEFMMMHTGTVC